MGAENTSKWPSSSARKWSERSLVISATCCSVSFWLSRAWRNCSPTVDTLSGISNSLLPLLRLPIQVNQNVPRLRPFARADDPAVFQFIHDARRPPIAEAQAPLQQRHAGL